MVSLDEAMAKVLVKKFPASLYVLSGSLQSGISNVHSMRRDLDYEDHAGKFVDIEVYHRVALVSCLQGSHGCFVFIQSDGSSRPNDDGVHSRI